MTKWKPPLTKAGNPCQRCKPGHLCPAHRVTEQKRRPGPKSKLTRELVDVINALAPQTTTHKALYEAVKVHPATWFRWLDEGEEDAQEGRTSLTREIYESIVVQRRAIADELKDAALDAARGHYVVQEEDGKQVRVYKRSPDGKLAANLSSRLDRKSLPPERRDVDVTSGGDKLIVELWSPRDEDGTGTD